MEYTNLSINLPNRIQLLDSQFSSVLEKNEFDVTYLLMKIYPVFLAPYERIYGSSHAKKFDKIERGELTKHLRINDIFNKSKYVKFYKWSEVTTKLLEKDVVKFHAKFIVSSELTIKDVLQILRNALAHSNICFGGKSRNRIDDIYFASNFPSKCDDIRILKCTVEAAEFFLDEWIDSIRLLGLSSGVIWDEIMSEEAA